MVSISRVLLHRWLRQVHVDVSIPADISMGEHVSVVHPCIQVRIHVYEHPGLPLRKQIRTCLRQDVRIEA